MPERDANQLAPNCPECGSGILNGEHIANYPCSRRDANQLAADAVQRLRALIPAEGFHYAWCNARPCTCEAQYDREALDELVALVGTLQQRSEYATESADHWLAATREANARAEAAEAALAAQADAQEGPWFPPPEWKDGWDGLVTAYDHERKYVGCIGRKTWDWLLKSGITEAQVVAAEAALAEARETVANLCTRPGTCLADTGGDTKEPA